MGLEIYTGARGSQFVCDNTKGFGDAVAAISIRADAPVNSCAREEAAEPLLRRIGKMSQKQLFACSLNCRPSCNGNCNPANPPGKSTHERRNDGVAYRLIAVFARLRYWQRGIDVLIVKVDAFIREAAKEGWLVTQTYPGSPSEAQHVNFRKKPRIGLWEFRPLTGGESGRRAKEVIRLLKKIQEPDQRLGYLEPDQAKEGEYGRVVKEAVKRFQRDHHMKADGEVDVRTITLLRGQAKRPPSRLDAKGVAMIVREEGEVLHCYNDRPDKPAEGNATFGVGHLLHEGPPTAEDFRRFGSTENPKPKDEMRKLSREFFNEDARKFERAVMKFVPQHWRDSHDEFNALFSVAFNFGAGVLTAEPPLAVLGEALKHKKGQRGRRAIRKAWHTLAEKNDPILQARRMRELTVFMRKRKGGPR